jgi:hypothetical protein
LFRIPARFYKGYAIGIFMTKWLWGEKEENWNVGNMENWDA